MLKEFTIRLQQWLENVYDPSKFGYQSKELFEKGYGFDLREELNIKELLAKVESL
jgi:hypothetical protein